MARPQLKIDAKEVERLASFGLSYREMAEFYQCSVDTLSRRYAEFFRKGRNNLKMRLRVKQIQVAMKGNPGMLRWLGIQYLGQSMKVDNAGSLSLEHSGKMEHDHKIPEGLLSPEETKVLDSLARRMACKPSSAGPSSN